jgi:hypothetical protein
MIKKNIHVIAGENNQTDLLMSESSTAVLQWKRIKKPGQANK